MSNPASILHRVPLSDQLRKCKVKGCKSMARITDYWYCREHRKWLSECREYQA